MNTASLELCRELYELSGWVDTYFTYEGTKVVHKYVDPVYQATDVSPAYDAEYLLQKLQSFFVYIGQVRLIVNKGGFRVTAQNLYFGSISADTAADAVAKFLIQLFTRDLIKEVDHEN